MSTFLFDILPHTGNVRSTLQLARLLHKREHEVYYTDTSDSVFTTSLLKQGIGRVLYPDDLKWFSPDMVLLDYRLVNRATFYQRINLQYLFVNTQTGTTEKQKQNGALHLPPSDNDILQLPQAANSKVNALPDKLSELKANHSSIIIIGLLEEGTGITNPAGFYEIMKKSCQANSRYQLLLLTNSSEAIKRLPPTPDNLMVYRLLNLPEVLPLCDIALTTGDLDTLTACIYANLPPIIYTDSKEASRHKYAMQFAKSGLGICNKLQGLTPKKFEQQIAQVLNNKEGLKAKLREAEEFFGNSNRELGEVADRLIEMINRSK